MYCLISDQFTIYMSGSYLIGCTPIVCSHVLSFFQGGIYLFDLFQEYSANISMLVVGFFEVIVVAYIYG